VAQKTDGTLSAVIRAARKHDPDPAHAKQVTRLALALFDELEPLHGYGPKKRRLLEAAARLHDIGWSRTVSAKHHKMSGAMIRELDIPGLKGKDLLTCALVARYHNKSLPDASRHRLFASLTRGRRVVVEWLAGVLRVADGLDSRHLGVVKRLSCRVKRSGLQIRIACTGDCRVEIEKAVRKQELLLRAASRPISYRCGRGNGVPSERVPEVRRFAE
jgi:exopolyphosphatase/guanosine-5'-triphosphate,3'-diphosphate pyrophosphatase